MHSDIQEPVSFWEKVKSFFLGKSKYLHDPGIFHATSLTAFFAWIGLGADGLTSSSYGPPEVFEVLKAQPFLMVYVILGTLVTIAVLSVSYSQIIEEFPHGGGGYIVASKLLSPWWGMISGAALLLDYMLVIAISIATGVDALFSLFPAAWQQWKFAFILVVVIGFIILNLRGVRESIMPLIPIFGLFMITHVSLLLYGLIVKVPELPGMVQSTVSSTRSLSAELGIAGLLFLILKGFSMGAGTYTGLEAVSNGLPILREPKVRTGKRTMVLMAVSLAFLVAALMFGFILFGVTDEYGKTVNAILYERITSGWGTFGSIVVGLTLFSEAAMLFVAAQTGFLDGPRVLSNMAIDGWLPKRFSLLSDRLVTQNAVLLMGAAALAMIFLSGGVVHFLVVLFSINVFITFLLSEVGMVRHYWIERHEKKHWVRKIAPHVVGMITSAVILTIVVAMKFHDGGWLTFLFTSIVVFLAMGIKRHYDGTDKKLRKLDVLIEAARSDREDVIPHNGKKGRHSCDPNAKTAVLFVKGLNGLGVKTIHNILTYFGGVFENFVFVEVGMVDTHAFKGSEEFAEFKEHVRSDVDDYVDLMVRHGYCAEGMSTVGVDVAAEMVRIAPEVLGRFPNAIFFGGKIVFPKDTFVDRLLYNQTVFSLQRKFYRRGIPFMVMPLLVE
ncbi:MAG: APC family permease [bacterium]